MKRFTYKLEIKPKMQIDQLEQILKEKGSNGWDLITVEHRPSTQVFYWKKEI